MQSAELRRFLTPLGVKNSIKFYKFTIPVILPNKYNKQKMKPQNYKIQIIQNINADFRPQGRKSSVILHFAFCILIYSIVNGINSSQGLLCLISSLTIVELTWALAPLEGRKTVSSPSPVIKYICASSYS